MRGEDEVEVSAAMLISEALHTLTVTGDVLDYDVDPAELRGDEVHVPVSVLLPPANQFIHVTVVTP